MNIDEQERMIRTLELDRPQQLRSRASLKKIRITLEDIDDDGQISGVVLFAGAKAALVEALRSTGITDPFAVGDEGGGDRPGEEEDRVLGLQSGILGAWIKLDLDLEQLGDLASCEGILSIDKDRTMTADQQGAER